MKYVMLEVAVSDKEELTLINTMLLDKKLVSSIQVVSSKSSWNYKGEREEAKEYLLFMKTKETLLKEIYEVIKSIHSYEVFEFAVFPLDSPNKDYLEWLDEETK